MDILVTVVNQKLKITTNLKRYVAGTQRFVRFIFDLPNEWKELTTFAQFRQGDIAYNQYLDGNYAAYMPAEIKAGKCLLMLFGSNNNAVIGTSNHLELTIDENMLLANADSTEVSNSLYAQLVEMVNEANQKMYEIEHSGTTVELVEETVQSEFEKYIANGTLTNYSPSAATRQTSDGAILTVTDKTGTTTTTILNGEDGGYYKPVFTQDGDRVIVSFTASNNEMPTIANKTLVLPRATISSADIEGGHSVTIQNGDYLITFDVMDGYSPSANVEETEDGAVITITDENGTTTATARHGEKGDKGDTGYSPSINVETISGGHKVTVVNENDSSTFEILDGKKGDTGDNGVSVEHSFSGTELTLTSASGTSTVDLKGDTGDNGATFTPSLTDEGDLSWTNDKGLDNPATVNIHGHKGDTGDSAFEIATQHGFEGSEEEWLDSLNGTDGISITSVKQTFQSDANDGDNVLTVTLSDGSTSDFTVQNGSKGEDGVSPIVNIEAITDGHRLSVTDANGTQSTDILDGADGISPIISVSKAGKVTTVTIVDVNGTHTATINDGADGDGSGDMLAATYDDNKDGVVNRADCADVASSLADDASIAVSQVNNFDASVRNIIDEVGKTAFSPTITSTDIEDGHRLTITDIDGEEVIDVMNGENATIINATANVNNDIGVPEVEVSLGGTDTARTFHFEFKNMKGDTGESGQSAYAAAQAGGYTDTESTFYADLAAIQGLAAQLAAI